jgi:spermidine synthase
VRDRCEESGRARARRSSTQHASQQPAGARSSQRAGSDPLAAAPFAVQLRVLIVASGGVALIYQSLWMRRLALVLGSTTYAVGTVLAGFMAVLGIGAFTFGKRVDRASDPLRLYAALELTIGVVGLASPFVLEHGAAPYALAYAHFKASPGLLTLARFVLGFAFVALPAFLMGGTLPVATRYMIRRSNQVGPGIAQLYALNTLGAAAGVLLVPFVLLPALGVRRTLLAAGVVNLGIAAAAWRGSRGGDGDVETGDRVAVPFAPASRSTLAAFFLSGFVALALEVVWNRFFVMYTGSSVYGYAIIAFLYLIGVVGGGMLFAILDRRDMDPTRVFLACLFLLVVDLAVTIPLMDAVIRLQLATLGAFGVGFASFQLASVLAASLVILPPTILFGISFPAFAKALTSSIGRIGSDLGRAYLVNTAGTTAGALVASFVLLPHLGLRASLEGLAFVTVLALALAASRAASPRRGVAIVLSAVALATVPAVSRDWDTRLMHTEISRQTNSVLESWRDGRFGQRLADMTVRAFLDGVDATVSIVDYGEGNRSLFVNGTPDGSDGRDMLTQALVAHLPLLAHPAPHRVLVIGMGTGVSLAAAGRYPVDSIDLVEISPEVLDLSSRWFETINRDVMQDPRLRVHLEDGRNFVAFDDAEPYDVILNEPSNPWMTGVASLFTDEFFAQLRQRLRPDGVLAQWFHYYNMDLDDVRTLLVTFRRHFAYVYVFTPYNDWQRGDMVILATSRPLDFTRLVRTMMQDEPAGRELRALGLGPEDLLQSFVLSPENLARFVDSAPLNTDDEPLVELHAPRALFHDTTNADLRAILDASEGARLPAAGGQEFAGGFDVDGPPGFHLTSRAFRVQVLPKLGSDGNPARDLLAEVRFEDDAGRQLVVLSTSRRLARDDLEHLAREVAGTTVVPDGAAIVDGHAAEAFTARGIRGATWSCWQSRMSYAAALSGFVEGNDGASPDPLRGLRCHQ